MRPQGRNRLFKSCLAKAVRQFELVLHENMLERGNIIPYNFNMKLATKYHNPSKIDRVSFYNCHRVTSSLLILELSFRSLLQGR